MNDYQWQKLQDFMEKGLDKTFLDYGVRKDDMHVLEKLAADQGIPFEIIEELLKTQNRSDSQGEAIDEKAQVKELEKLIRRLI
jgi:hypothetical protein